MALDPVSAGLDLANTVVKTIWPDKTEQERAQLAAAVQLVQGQIDTNKVEAENTRLFVAGWRPFVGWICGVAVGFKFIGGPLLFMVGQALGHPVELPQIETAELWPLLLGMLGLGSLRTLEKVKGAA